MAKTAKKSTQGKSVANDPSNAMDYSEHEKTYDLFIWLSKWGVVACVALLLAMMLGFFGGGGLVGGTIAFIVLMIIAFFIV